MRLCEFQEKEVINVADCCRLGHVIDIDFCEKDGRITAIIVSGSDKLWCCFSKTPEYVIPWCKIKCIGPDIILVDICLDGKSK